jgi:hypothetical protein
MNRMKALLALALLVVLSGLNSLVYGVESRFPAISLIAKAARFANLKRFERF